ncbi:16S rRNA (guanine(527)-N(7))-methyltransferase RsmG [Candidatus Mycoplasma pogonae]
MTLENEKKFAAYVNNLEIFAKLQKYVALIERENQKMNLTGFSGERLWLEGILESIILLKAGFDQFLANQNNAKILDIGAGVGFPSVPYLIYLNGKHEFVIYEPSSKRVKFLNLVKQELDLQNLTIIQTRAEDVKQYDIFDCITARAVTELKQLIQISYHLGKKQSQFCFLKGPKFSEEITKAKELKKVIPKLNFEIEKITISNLDKDNYLIKFQKLDPTPKGYPLPWSQIIKK